MIEQHRSIRLIFKQEHLLDKTGESKVYIMNPTRRLKLMGGRQITMRITNLTSHIETISLSICLVQEITDMTTRTETTSLRTCPV